MASKLRFYGSHPPDWDEGAADGHLFSVQLQRRPTDAELEQIASLYEEALAAGPARPASEAWRWSDRFASFLVGERGGGSSAFIDAVHGFLVRACEIVPIVDAVFHGARGGSGPQQPPDAGPDFGPTACPDFQRPVDTSLPTPAASEVFERGRYKAQHEAADGEMAQVEAKIAEMIGERKRGQVGIARTSVQPSAATFPQSSWSWVPQPGDPPVEHPPEILAAFNIPGHPQAAGDHMIACRERPVACILEVEYQYNGLAYLDEAGNRKEVSFPEKIWWMKPGAYLHPSGDRCLLLADRKIFDVDLTSGRARRIFHDSQVEVYGAVYLQDERVAVATEKDIRLLNAKLKKPRVLDTLGGASQGLSAIYGGRVLISSNRLRVIACAGDKLNRIGAFPTDDLWFAEERDGRVLLASSVKGAFYELTHLEEVYDKLEQAVIKKKAKKKATGKKAT